MAKKKPVAAGDLTQIPGIGPNIKRHLSNIGIETIEDLRGRDPEELYQRDGLVKGTLDDRCLLYVYRLAVYYADHQIHQPEKLKWWYWKDKEYPDNETP